MADNSTASQPDKSIDSDSEIQNPAPIPLKIMKDDVERSRFPYCIVWTPLPLISWILPFIGHLGIAYSNGVIRDFAGPYHVSEDDMAFGKPTRLWRLEPRKVQAYDG